MTRSFHARAGLALVAAGLMLALSGCAGPAAAPIPSSDAATPRPTAMPTPSAEPVDPRDVPRLLIERLGVSEEIVAQIPADEGGPTFGNVN